MRPKTIAVFADPVFGAQDPRIGSISKNRLVENPALEQAGDVKRSAEESGLNGFPRLRFSRQEADQIMRLVPGSNSLEALDFAASRSAATSADLSQYRIVHFATHGLINNGMLTFQESCCHLWTRKANRKTAFSRLYDIYNMNLSPSWLSSQPVRRRLAKISREKVWLG